MRRALLLLAALACATSCGGEDGIPATDLMVRVTLGAHEVAPGRGFPVEVVRVWAKDLEPSPWDDAALSPLVLRAATTSRREDAARIEETRRYRAYAFTLKDVTIPPVAFVGVPRAGGTPRIAASDGLALRVRPVLDPAAPGPPEGPGGRPIPPPTRWPWLAALVAAALALLAARRRIRRAAPQAPAPTAPARARAALARIRAGDAADAAARAEDARRIAAAVRPLAGAWTGLPAHARTSEELLRAFGRVPRLGELLAAVLAPCDRATFGALPPSAAERAALLDAADAFVHACAGGGA